MEWISVKERLPEDKEWVLISGYNWIGSLSAQYQAKEERFEPDTDWIEGYDWQVQRLYLKESNAKGNNPVTHWMPLPKPPTKEA